MIIRSLDMLAFLFSMILLILNRVCGYHESSMQFHPEGKILQIEYAFEAVKRGNPILAVKCNDGIIIMSAKKTSDKPSLVKKGFDKIFYVGNHICIAATGLLIDSLILKKISNQIVDNYYIKYGENIPIENFCEEMAVIFHHQTKISSRPLGVSMIVSGIDNIFGPQLYTVDPDGSYYSWFAVALGEDSERIRGTLIECFPKCDLSVYDGNMVSAAEIIKSSIIKKHFNVEDDESYVWDLQVCVLIDKLSSVIILLCIKVLCGTNDKHTKGKVKWSRFQLF